MTYRIIFNDELYHHGIRGQQWYVRRFQNEDGTLTAAGRERYGYGNKRPTHGTFENNDHWYSTMQNHATLTGGGGSQLITPTNGFSDSVTDAASKVASLKTIKSAIKAMIDKEDHARPNGLTDRQRKLIIDAFEIALKKQFPKDRELVHAACEEVRKSYGYREHDWLTNAAKRKTAGFIRKHPKVAHALGKTKREVSGFVNKGKEYLSNIFNKNKG